MNTHTAIRSVTTALLGITLTALPGKADLVSNFSAADCIPRSAASSDGSGAEGFRWDDTSGAFVNTDANESEDLVCPVPYDPILRRTDGVSIPVVHVTVEGIDQHNAKSLSFTLSHQLGNGTRFVAGSRSSGDSFRGRISLDVPFTPSADTRYIWFRVTVPSSNSGGRSGVFGYQVIRRL